MLSDEIHFSSMTVSDGEVVGKVRLELPRHPSEPKYTDYASNSQTTSLITPTMLCRGSYTNRRVGSYCLSRNGRISLPCADHSTSIVSMPTAKPQNNVF